MSSRSFWTRPQSPWWRALSWLLSTLALMLLAIAGWITYRFGRVTFEMVVTNLPIGPGRGIGNESLAPEALVVCVALPVAVSTAAALGLWLWRTRTRRPPARRKWLGAPMTAFAASLAVLLTVAGVPQHATAVLSGQSIAPYYVPPRVTGTPDKPLNVITIYLESIENGFTDETVFGENLLADLDRSTEGEGWHRYDGLQQYPGGGWTMAGLVSSQCGIPLKSRVLSPGADPNNVGEQVDHYLPGAVCLGDVLGENGYTNAWLGGADTQFAGKNTFLTDHGYTQIQGRKDWVAAGEDPAEMSIWGLSDHRLFAQARTTVDRLRAADDPFHLTILTLDTHEPAGIFPSCDTGDAVAMATGIKCSMRAAAGFIDHLEASGQLEDTVVIVMGDHLKGTSGASDYKAEMDSFDERTILLRIWSPEKVQFRRESTDQFTMFATTLELLDFQLAGGRAGLGVSVVGEHDLTGTALTLTPGEYRSLVGSPSLELYEQFWQGADR